MKVLLTGAFGNIGVSALDEMLRRSYEVRCFDLPTPANRRTAGRYTGRAEIAWGDLRHPDEVAKAVEGMDVVLHTAFIIPKLSSTGIESELRPDLAHAVNVGGTANVIAAIQQQPRPPRLVFTSSLHVYGRTMHLEPPRRASDPVNPIEHYACHKVECEEMIRGSGLTWAILRLAASMPIALKLDPGMFDVPLDNRMEYVHTRDVGLALANAAAYAGADTPTDAAGPDTIWGKTLLIGGGPRCQLIYRDIVRQILGSMGLETLPASAFATVPFATDWLDTEESQRLLQYQTRTLDDYVTDMKRLLGPRLPFVRLFRGQVRRSLLAQSPHWMRQVEQARAGGLSGKTAVVTGASSGIGAATARALAHRGAHVILVARREERLTRLADEICRDGGSAHVIVADLSNDAARERVLAEVIHVSGGIDVLVNCAGLGWYGYGADMPWSLAQEMVQTNVAAVAHLTLGALRHMRARDGGRGAGHIINLSSVAGSLPEQGIAVYSATRSFVDAFTTALHREARGSRVRVSLIRPGAVRTEFYDRAAGAASGRPIPGATLGIPAERVAAKVLAVLRRPQRVTYVPIWGIVTPWIEPAFGWLIDLLGPALLRRPPHAAATARSHPPAGSPRAR